jgi:uncharacterized protein YraI
MTAFRIMICAAAITLVSAAGAAADPAYVASTVNLRAGATTGSDILAKIPGGSLVDASNCSDWCEVEWQGKKGYAIASALDRSGRVPARRAAGAPRGAYSSGAYVEDDDYVPVGPPAVYAPPPYYYGYRPYYWGYGARWGYGYHRGWRRW